MMISKTTILSEEDWQNLNGNEVFVTMLRNKLKCSIDKGQAVKRNSDDYRTKEENPLFDLSLEYLNEVPEDLVYYNIDNVYGWKTIYVYFHSPVDKENFYHYYNMQLGIEEVQK